MADTGLAIVDIARSVFKERRGLWRGGDNVYKYEL